MKKQDEVKLLKCRLDFIEQKSDPKVIDIIRRASILDIKYEHVGYDSFTRGNSWFAPHLTTKEVELEITKVERDNALFSEHELNRRIKKLTETINTSPYRTIKEKLSTLSGIDLLFVSSMIALLSTMSLLIIYAIVKGVCHG